MTVTRTPDRQRVRGRRRRDGFDRPPGESRAAAISAQAPAQRPLDVAYAKLKQPPFDLPDPYNSLAVPLREAIAQRIAPALPLSDAGGALDVPTPPGHSFHSRPPSPGGEGEEKDSTPHASRPSAASPPAASPSAPERAPVVRPWIPAAVRAQMDN
ncbi:MAG: hypothetical protein K8F62_11840, partial [Pseudorhodoplanes sp.]|nr:hypothetical protein [Pseudorhodoplanes sp.]